MTMTWKAGRQLEAVTLNYAETETSAALQYYYNSDGFVSRIDMYENGVYSSSEQFIWNGEQLVARCSLNSSGAQTVARLLYDTDGEAYGYIINEATVYLYRKNLLGDITGLIDGETGDIVAECAYDAYGNLTIINATGLQKLAYLLRMYSSPLLYRGYVCTTVGDQISYYLGSRFYIPKYGRFFNADKHFDTGTGVIGTNMFAYCNNNPIMFTDPSGESWLAGAAAAIGVPTSTLVCAALILIIMVDVLTGGNVILTFTEALTLIIEQIYFSISSSIASSKDLVLDDTTAKIPENKVYQLAYINKQGELIRLYTKYSFTEIVALLGITGVVNLSNQYEYAKQSEAQSTVQPLAKGKRFWGVYTHSQSAAKALAYVFSCDQPPEVHGSGMYGHYNDKTHSFHIWFGGKITY